MTLEEMVKTYTEEDIQNFLEFLTQMSFRYFQTIFKNPPSDIMTLTRSQVAEIFLNELDRRRN